MALVGHEDDEGSSDWHGHDDEGPRDPGRVVVGEEAGLGAEIDGDGNGYGEDGDEGDGERESKRLGPPGFRVSPLLTYSPPLIQGFHLPVQAVEIKDLRDPNQGREVIEPVVHKQEEPKVDEHSRLSVAGHLSTDSRLCERRARVVVQRVLRKRNCAPRNSLETISSQQFQQPGFQVGGEDVPEPPAQTPTLRIDSTIHPQVS